MGGQWRTVKFNSIPEKSNDPSVRMGDNELFFELSADPLPREPPPNIHADKPFLVSIMFGGPSPTSPLGIAAFDWQYSLLVHVEPEGQVEAYEHIAIEILTKKESYVHLWRWAKRVSDWELSICVDREPSDDDVPW